MPEEQESLLESASKVWERRSEMTTGERCGHYLHQIQTPLARFARECFAKDGRDVISNEVSEGLRPHEHRPRSAFMKRLDGAVQPLPQRSDSRRRAGIQKGPPAAAKRLERLDLGGCRTIAAEALSK
jgi:hypothetical protein